MINTKKIFYRIMSEKNIEGLEKYPIDKKFDFAVGYRVFSGPNEDGVATSSPISLDDLANAGVKREDLYELAQQNTAELFKPELYTLESLVARITAGKEASNLWGNNKPLSKSELYVLTNNSGMFGASVILQYHILREISERLGCAFYVLPSSVHEIILAPKLEEYDLSMLKETVHAVNSTVVSESDYLSDSVYEYDAINGLQICDVDNTTTQAV